VQHKQAMMLVEHGECQTMYGATEEILSTKRWVVVISSIFYKGRLRQVAIDEAHCIYR
jgi:superfamily II DNA helicase RecQ